MRVLRVKASEAPLSRLISSERFPSTFVHPLPPSFRFLLFPFTLLLSPFAAFLLLSAGIWPSSILVAFSATYFFISSLFERPSNVSFPPDPLPFRVPPSVFPRCCVLNCLSSSFLCRVVFLPLTWFSLFPAHPDDGFFFVVAFFFASTRSPPSYRTRLHLAFIEITRTVFYERSSER